ncbi:MAG: hypothetical protein Q9168_003233 [Polycauliona sp. 1 TL-2023]
MSDHLHTSAALNSAPRTLSPPADTLENTKKRKRSPSQDSASQPQPGRLKQSYNTKYHGLLNDTVSDLLFDPATAVTDKAHITQTGICLWSPHETRLLFDGIARYGQDSLPAIAALIATKSELEVQTYVQSLKAASVKQHMYGKKQSLVGIADIPAAVELSEECCASVEQAAESLATLQQRQEEQSERQRHADLWKLDQGKARWVERRMGESEEGRLEIQGRLPAAGLLNLGQLLKLSRNFFMNAADLEINWRSLSSTSRSETPALMYTAFSDLHDITVSIISRLVQNTLFFAMSRLRAAKSPYYPHQRAAKRCDVQAATRVLGMKRSARDGWSQVARRCKLEVYDQARGSGIRHEMNYSEVERVLREKKSPAEARARQGESTDDDHELNEGSISEDQSVSLVSTSDESHHSPPQHNAATDPKELVDKIGRKADAYLDFIDRGKSEKEEARLWKMLGKDPPGIRPCGKPTQAEDPGPQRQGRNELKGWREWVDLKPEWEVYDVQQLGAGLENNRIQAQLKERLSPKSAMSSKQSKRLSVSNTSSGNESSAADMSSSENEQFSNDTGSEVTENIQDGQLQS